MKLFDQAELANLSDEDVETYEESLKHMRDYTNTIESAERRGFMEGKIEGRMDEKIEIVKSALSESLPFALIQKLTGLSENEILRIKHEIC